MGNIIVLNEDKRPRVICPHCKSEVIVDIRDFNKDISKLAIYTCNICRGQFFGGVLLLAAARMETLLENIQKVVKAVNSPNTLQLGDKEITSIGKPQDDS